MFHALRACRWDISFNTVSRYRQSVPSPLLRMHDWMLLQRTNILHLDEEELAEWRTIFNLFDVDGDESITGEVSLVVRIAFVRVSPLICAKKTPRKISHFFWNR